MPRASALAPQAVSVVGSLFISRVHKVDNSTGSKYLKFEGLSQAKFLPFAIIFKLNNLSLVECRGCLSSLNNIGWAEMA